MAMTTTGFVDIIILSDVRSINTLELLSEEIVEKKVVNSEASYIASFRYSCNI